jgi:hypothetical protein
MLLVPSGMRLRFVTGCGPFGRGSKLNAFLPNLPEKSGMDAALCADVSKRIAPAVPASIIAKKNFRCKFLLLLRAVAVSLRRRWR